MEQKMNERNVYGANGGNRKEKNMMEKIVGGIAVVFSGMFIVPILSVLSGAFGLIGIGLPAITLLNLFGLTHIPFNVLFVTLTGFPQIFVGFLVGMIFIALSFICGSILKKYAAMAKRTF
ncbi:hypothetical protein [Candidatus Enterococcus murrayae]|uniref:Uncharacterized protein n=1 Tax=Candidatus Enterococcus murrayae TaxID=2815321 RepID=A0ABS3HK20_9ENTE|nr:hypothetical protein [Enterococcus sp. MJM16]MBO0453362.1 hypothetical protein [Enterococcus sp. MJM16]